MQLVAASNRTPSPNEIQALLQAMPWSCAVLAADRSIRDGGLDPSYLQPGEMGNHEDGLNVVTADAATQYLRTEFDPAVLTDLADPEGDALGIVTRGQ